MANTTNIISSKKAYMNYFKNLKQMAQVFGLFIFLISAIGITSCGTVDNTGAPNADAGDSQEILVGEEAQLDGQASTGVENSTWSFSSTPDGSAAVLGHSNSLVPTFTPDVAGDYVVELSINGGASTDTVTITASEVQAIISTTLSTRTRFGAVEYVTDMASTDNTLSAEGSRASVSALTKKQVKAATISSYAWEQVSGPTVTIVGDSTSSTLTFTSPSDFTQVLNGSDRFKWQVLPISRNDTRMVFKLTVTSADGSTDTDTIQLFLQNGGAEIHTSSGLNTVAVGDKVQLSGPNRNGSSGVVTDWAWALAVPVGSSATFTGGGVASTSEFPSFTPDVAGTYTLTYSSTTANTTASVPIANSPGTIVITATDYVGIGNVGGTTAASPQCATCHDGSVEEDKVTEYLETKHASVFEDGMTIYTGLTPEPYLWQYHTVGYNKDATNSGFDDLASAAGFTYPVEGMTFESFTTNYPTVSKLANVQCENCHGPGNAHAGDASHISFSFSNSGVCGQCHVQEDQWKNSAHNSTSTSTYAGWVTNKVCTRCHVSKGFNTFIEGGQAAEVVLTGDADAFGGVGCVSCHDPHNVTNDFQLRFQGEVTLDVNDDTINAGKAAVCYKCHMGNREIDESDCDSNADGVADTACLTFDQTALQYAGGGYHDVPQGTMLEGLQLLELDNMDLNENSYHSGDSFILSEVTGDSTLPSTNNKCVTCHMAKAPAANEPGYQRIGGHAFAMVAADGTEQVAACQPCHGDELTELNREARADYDGDGTVEGVQDEIKGLLVNVTTLIKSKDTIHINQNTDVLKTSAATGTSGTYVEAAGTIHTGTISYNGATTTLTAGTKCSTKPNAGIWISIASPGFRACNFNATSETLRRAMWNINSIVNDGSFGIHNAAYTVQGLQQTYSALRILLDGQASTWTYQSDFPNATNR